MSTTVHQKKSTTMNHIKENEFSLLVSDLKRLLKSEYNFFKFENRSFRFSNIAFRRAFISSAFSLLLK